MTAFLRYFKVLIKTHHFKINPYFVLMATVTIGLICFILGVLAVAGISEVKEHRFRYDDKWFNKMYTAQQLLHAGGDRGRA